jgi:hypothetical protein
VKDVVTERAIVAGNGEAASLGLYNPARKTGPRQIEKLVMRDFDQQFKILNLIDCRSSDSLFGEPTLPRQNKLLITKPVQQSQFGATVARVMLLGAEHLILLQVNSRCRHGKSPLVGQGTFQGSL